LWFVVVIDSATVGVILWRRLRERRPRIGWASAVLRERDR